MGNDEFILYIRKTSGCKIPTDQLGKAIWIWLRDNDAKKYPTEMTCEIECLWGAEADNVSELGLPKTATQFIFDRDLLPKLYDFLDSFKNKK